jgi:hypothetical protein
VKRYKQLIYNEKTYTEDYKIDEILVKNKFEWFLDCEVENCRLEITKNTLVFNSGVFFNGTWKYGVFRDGQWKYGTWEGGVWYNGTWYNGIFQNGLIFGGRFINGKIEGGEIRGGEFFDVKINKLVVNNTIQKIEQKHKPMQGQPQNRGIQQHQPYTEEENEVDEPQGVQPQKIEENYKIKRFMTYVKTYEGFVSKVKDFFKESPCENDDLGNTIINYIENNDFNIEKKEYGGGPVYKFIIRKNVNELDPYGEDSWGDDMTISVKEIKEFESYGVYVRVNNDELHISRKIKYKLPELLEDKYLQNKKRERENRIKKYNSSL